MRFPLPPPLLLHPHTVHIHFSAWAAACLSSQRGKGPERDCTLLVPARFLGCERIEEEREEMEEEREREGEGGRREGEREGGEEESVERLMRSKYLDIAYRSMSFSLPVSRGGSIGSCGGGSARGGRVCGGRVDGRDGVGLEDLWYVCWWRQRSGHVSKREREQGGRERAGREGERESRERREERDGWRFFLNLSWRERSWGGNGLGDEIENPKSRGTSTKMSMCRPCET